MLACSRASRLAFYRRRKSGEQAAYRHFRLEDPEITPIYSFLAKHFPVARHGMREKYDDYATEIMRKETEIERVRCCVCDDGRHSLGSIEK